MRDALNNNPLVQAAAIGVLAVIVGFLLLTRVMGQSEPEPATTDPAAASAQPGAAADATATPPADASAPQSESTAPATDPSAPADATGVQPTDATADAAVDAAAAGEFVAGPGLPGDVVKAYADGKVVVLLVELETGIDDRKVKKTVEMLRSRGDTAVFLVPADEIADYSRITQGVNVERTPALVVITPRRLTEGSIPVASVAYGFRGSQSVDQAVEDALYKGRQDLPYYPE